MIAIPAGDNNELVAAYVTEKTGSIFVPGMYQAIAILDDDGVFQGGVIISDFKGYDCQLSTAAETPVAWRTSVLRAVFDYVFNQLGCVRCTAMTKKSNKRARTFLEGLGFTLEGKVRKGYEGIKDVMLYGLLAEECVYIQEVVDEPETTSPVAPAAPETVEAATDVPDIPVGPTKQEAVEEFW